MATVFDAGEFTVFKFHSSGIIALCQEIAEYAKDGTLDRYNVDTTNVRFENTQGEYRFVFGLKEDGRG